MKVEDLEGALLEYWVARAEGIPAETLVIAMAPAGDKQTCSQRSIIGGQEFRSRLDYTSNWGSGGPIIERERINLEFMDQAGWLADLSEWNEGWMVEHLKDIAAQYGPTPLIAAMRAYVASKFGDAVEDS
jgi:hypothetical protein